MYNNYNPYNPYYRPYNEQMSVQQQNVPTMQQTTLNVPKILQGKQVASKEVVMSADIPLDGSISYFPLADGSSILTKQLQMDGTSKIVEYKAILDTKEEKRYITPDELESALNEVDLSELEDIKEQIKEIKQELKDLKKKKKDD